MATVENAVTEGEMIARRIRAVRKLTGKTQADFARIVGVSRSFLSEVEATKAKPSVEMIVGVAANFPDFASPFWLLLGYGEPGRREVAMHAPTGIDWQGMLCAQQLHATLSEAVQPHGDKAEAEAKTLTFLVNAYAKTYALAVARGESEKDARREARGRVHQLAQVLASDMDAFIAEGPPVAL